VVTLPAGEAHKTRDTWARATDAMLAAGCGRDTTVVALGGGVVGDLAGFVAATYLRGVPVVQVPTTLLAMLDASVGGKTAVDTPAGKNLVGAFHPPAAVLIDPALLATLPAPDLAAGAAEALKHGVIASAAHFDDVAALLPRLARGEADPAALARLVGDSVAVKAAVVAEDLTERGRRKTLNFGHTLGHAVEHASGYALRHGEAGRAACRPRSPRRARRHPG
jgi:3-dehydroquinate synthase